MKQRTALMLGACLTGLAFVGFLTVADDLRHTGELFAVIGILGAGATFLFMGMSPGNASNSSLYWVPAGIGVGMLVGAFVDREAVSVSMGILIGVGLAFFFSNRGAPKRTSSAES